MTRRASPAAGRTFPWERLDPDRRNALLLYGGIAVVLLFVFALIAWGYYEDRIAPNHETVLTVGGRDFDVAFLERRVKADLRVSTPPENATLRDVVASTLQKIEIEEVTRQAAQELGMTVTEDDIDKAILDDLGLPEDTPRNSFAEFYRRDVLKLGLPVNEYREIKETEIIKDRLEEQYKTAVPAEEEQADAQILRATDEETVKQAKQRIEAGEAFSPVAAQLSIDSSKSSGGELGWVARGQMRPKVGEALFTLPIGQISDPIEETDGWYIVVARGREVRPNSDQQKDGIANQMYASQIIGTRAKVGSSVQLTEDQIALIGRHLVG